MHPEKQVFNEQSFFIIIISVFFSMKYDFRIKKYPGHCAQERLIIATERIVLGQ